jgi:4-amino-4-deoxy-L-arabinose transferase-like glycosyltransferase
MPPPRSGEDRSAPVGSPAYVVLAVYAFALLSIGLTRDWQLRHEDNGAMHTTLALSHQRLGLARTRAHDLFFNPHTGEAAPYGHHPPATALIVAGAFALTGSDSPAVARLAVIVFHLGSVLLVTRLLVEFFPPSRALLGGFLMATLPMSTYFGRMVNYEPLCLFAILVQLYGFVRYRLGHRRGLIWLVAGILMGGVIDWASFFFAAALAVVEGVDLFLRRSRSAIPLALMGAAAASVFAFDLAHLWYASSDGFESLRNVAASSRPFDPNLTVRRFVFGQIDTFRRYFTHVGLIASVLVWVSLARPRRPLSSALFTTAHPDVLRRTLTAASLAAVAYVLAAPSWAMAHQYWQFYFLPAVVLSILTFWTFLERSIRARPGRALRALQVICVVDLLISSAYWLHFRHTRVEAYAVETTAMLRARFLAPSSIASGEGR